MIDFFSPNSYCAGITSGGATRVPRGSLVACGLFVVAFTTAGSLPPYRDPFFNMCLPTSSGIPAPGKCPRPETAIGELRRVSGLTWDQIARIFDVSRRSLHHWASGAPLSSGNEEKLYRVLATIRRIDRGIASENRAALLSSTSRGFIPLDMLIAGDFEDVVAVLGEPMLEARVPVQRSSRSTDTNSPSVADLMDVRQDVIHREVGGGRTAKSMRVRGSDKAG